MPVDASLRQLVRGLLQGSTATRRGEVFLTNDTRRAAAMGVLNLISDGVLDGDATSCRANKATAAWLRRVQLDRDDAFACQHRVTAQTAEGVELNLAESPLARLATGIGGEAGYLERHQLEAGERVRRLVERARLQPRLTMAYSAAHSVSTSGNSAGDISDLAADARKSLADLHRVLPRDCAGVVLDVCGLLKGLQEVERERGWPRRSAKLVLRIGLDHLARHYGYAPSAVGRSSGRPRGWMEEGARPDQFG
jgi:hypothetical protein